MIYSDNIKYSSAFCQHFEKKNHQNPIIFDGVMAILKRCVMGQKPVFREKVHEILIFQYYSNNKYCADVADTPVYEVALNSVDRLLSYRPLTILTTRLYVSLVVHY